jgi:hypothetical protein
MPPNDIEAAIDNLLDHYDERGVPALKLAAMDCGPLVAEFLMDSRSATCRPGRSSRATSNSPAPR